MIAFPNLSPSMPRVVRRPGELAHLLDVLKDEAALEMGAAFKGVSGKRIDAANVPGCGRHGVSRAINGSETNPLFRLAALFVLMKRLGMGRERALRVVGWLRELVDAIWPEEEERSWEETMGREQEIDSEEDRHQVDACLGIPGAAARMLEVVRHRHAHDAVVISVLRQRVAAEHHG